MLFLASVLGQRRHTVRAAANLASARELAASEDFDLVISDIELPDGSGLELMHEIKTTRGFPGIAMSGYGSDEDIRMSRAAGFAAHLTKPINFQTLECDDSAGGLGGRTGRGSLLVHKRAGRNGWHEKTGEDAEPGRDNRCRTS